MTLACRLVVVSMTMALLGACSGVEDKSDAVDTQAMLQRIEQAAATDGSSVHVVPLRKPGVATLQAKAEQAIAEGRLDDAAVLLDRALKLKPGAPPVLQAQAELALRQGQWARAEDKALASWKKGPQSGALCARNWQTVLEVRRHAGDASGASTASKWREQCRIEAVERF